MIGYMVQRSQSLYSRHQHFLICNLSPWVCVNSRHGVLLSVSCTLSMDCVRHPGVASTMPNSILSLQCFCSVSLSRFCTGTQSASCKLARSVTVSRRLWYDVNLGCNTKGSASFLHTTHIGSGLAWPSTSKFGDLIRGRLHVSQSLKQQQWDTRFQTTMILIIHVIIRLDNNDFNN